jgi:chaperonin GroES
MKKEDKQGIMPLGDRVLLKPLSPEDKKSPSGIIIPDTVSKEKPEQGKVIAVGDGKWNEDGDKKIPVRVKVGDTVVFSKYGYDEIKVDGEEFYIVSENNILAVIK